MPIVSIITPVYIDINEKLDWLDQTIQSVIHQTLTDWELILIDDKSPISTSEIKAKYADDKRLRWLVNAENSKPSRTRNTAVALAESDCILPLDSDDMLASPDVLQQMYDVWQQDKSQIVYGNLVQLINGKRREFNLRAYSFENVLNLDGTIPVTAMHSVNCHQKAGGWKTELDDGLEDVEYWIAAGERGCCGQKVPVTTLLYRRQEHSRAYILKHVKQNFKEMQQKIRDLHHETYDLVFNQRRCPPMACGCGSGKTNNAQATLSADPVVMSAQNQNVNKITELKDFDESEKEWVSYQGAKTGNFSVLVRGPANLPSNYLVLGKGHYFQIHKRQHSFFEQRQHMGFRVNQPDPRQQQEPVKTEIEEPVPSVVQMPKPELSTLVSLDTIGSQTRQADIVPPKDSNEVIIEPNAPKSYSGSMGVTDSATDVTELGLSQRITDMLGDDHWSVERLAQANFELLIKYNGIGTKRAKDIIRKAQALINEHV